MGQTIIGVGDALAVKRFSVALAVDAPRKAHWTRKYMGTGDSTTMPIRKLTDLETQAGDQMNFQISMQLNQQPIEGEDEAEGKGEKLSFYSQNIYIDQQRGVVAPGGQMTQKRTVHDLRKIARGRSAEWWGRVFDQTIFAYLSGARGVNSDWVYPSTWTGRANNSLTTPDSSHIVYGGVATAKADLTATDTMSTLPIDKAVAYAKAMGGGGPVYSEVPQIQPTNIDGEEVFLCVMSTYQAFNLRRNSTSMDWADIQKAMAMSTGKSNEFIKGGLGMWNKVVLQEHPSVVTFSDYGSGTNLNAARALFCGSQAGVIAQGQPGNDMSFKWVEVERDGGDKLEIFTSTKWGFVKTTFNGYDFGVIAIDTYATRP
jgi:N4-gp56 family major capsid protein